MEVYTLDSLLRRVTVTDVFDTLIWTERWQAYGDFQLVVEATRENRQLFTPETKLAMNESYRVMVVKTAESKTAPDGTSLLTVKGYSLEDKLNDRVAKSTLSTLTTEPTWNITGRPADIVRTMFDHICRTGALDPGDVIPFLMTGPLLPASTIPEPQVTIAVSQSPDSLYNAIKNICTLYDLGFRLIRNFDTSQLYFDVYAGSDRTTAQTQNSPVVFSPELDNLQNTTEFSSSDQTKNCAYVFSSQGFEVVYPLGVAPDVAGFERHVLMVQGTDLPTSPTPTAAQISASLQQQGQDALTKLRAWTSFDGEIDQSNSYKYGVDYQLGDLVEMRNSDNEVNNMRVTEQIFVQDQNGERHYPTLTIYAYINPGSWLSWNYNQVWHDLDSDTTSVWGNQP